jgi:flippase wzx
MNNLKQKVFSGMLWKFSERILAQLISFAVSIVIARILSPEEYGLVAMVMIFINIANVFIVNGFNTALIQKTNADEIDFSTLFYCSLFISIIFYIILFLAAPFIAKFYNNEILIKLLRVFGLILPLSSYKSIQNAWVSKRLEFKKFFFSTLGGTLVSAVIGISMAIAGFGVWALVAQFFSNAIIDAIILSFTIAWHPKLLFSIQAVGPLFSYSSKILGADLIGTVYNQLNAFFIAKKYTPSDLAFYTKGKQFPDLIDNNICSSIISVLFPALSSGGSDYVRVKQMGRQAVRTSAFILLPFYFGLMAVSGNLITVLLTEKWYSCVPFMYIMCITGVLNIIGIIDIQLMKAIGKSGTVLKIEFIKKPVFFMILIFALRYSIFALACTVPITAFLANIINGLCVQRYCGYSLWEKVKDIWTSFIIAALMGVTVFLLNRLPFSQNIVLLLQLLFGILFYIFLSYMTKNENFYYVINLIKAREKEGVC